MCALFSTIGGYLPLNFFHWTNLNGKASHRYISARCYTTDGLCHWFGGMNQDLLPLCAVLTGNDYGAPKETETLLSLLNVTALRRSAGQGRSGTSRIEGLLLWLSSFSCSAQALDEVSRLMGEEGRDGGGKGRRGQRSELRSQLWAGMQEYHITPQSSLASWFSEAKVPCGWQTSGLPKCLLVAAAQGLLDPLVVNAAVMRRALLFPQVENSKLASSHWSARTIRQALYGIVLHRGQTVQVQDVKVQETINQGARDGRGRGGRGWRGGHVGGGRGQGVNVAAGVVQAQVTSVPIYVDEYDRMDLNLKRNQVEAHPPRTPLQLERLEQVNITYIDWK